MTPPQPQDREREGERGVVQAIRESPLDIVVHPAKGDDVLIKAGDDVLLLDRAEAQTLAREIREKLGSDR